ncbi:DUF2164 domain-containing protein [Vibrio hannami]|uniref:DUF2164 domain-containing protein n=1 Tax=Vibrio hannami TaxID=2717094 RepID=UPI00240FE56B|nr:DUF2164 domain-containing protein [Vibrio hannami]MDG3085423.1 DUF2164 domain-containing protein [Vibrio hannami]
MSDIKLDTIQKEAMISLLQDYFDQELNTELGQFDADFLIDFISKKMGSIYYNQGVKDAQAVIERKVIDIADELYEIEKETDL